MLDAGEGIVFAVLELKR